MTQATATQNLNSKLRPTTQGVAKGKVDFGTAPISSSSPPVSVVRRPGYQGGGYLINV